MSITTKTGDKGKTTCNYQIVTKDHVLVETVGTIDELQAVLGIVKIKFQIPEFKIQIEEIQKDLMRINGELACGKKFEEINKRVDFFEAEIMRMEKELPELKEFVVPGKNEIEAFLHLGRTIARRTERRVVSLNNSKKIDEDVLKYFNRLSDYLFIISRTI